MKLVASPHVPRHQSSDHVSSTLTPAAKSYSYTTRQEEEKGEALGGALRRSFPLQTLTRKLKMGSGRDLQQNTSGEEHFSPSPAPGSCSGSWLHISASQKRWKGGFDAVEETPVKTLPRAQTLWLLLGPTQRLPAQARQQLSPAWSVSGRHREKHVTPGRAGEPPGACCTLAPIHQLCPGLELQSSGHPSHTHTPCPAGDRKPRCCHRQLSPCRG